MANTRLFDGVDDVVKVADQSAIRPAAAITMAVLFRTGATAGESFGSIMHKKLTTGNASYAIQHDGSTNGVLYFNMHNGTSQTFTGDTTALTASTWFLAVGRCAGNANPLRLRIYNLDGSVNQNATDSSNFTGSISYDTNPLHFGEHENLGNWAGNIAVAGLWNSSISDSTAASLVIGLQEWVDASPSALWAFNQTSTATAVEDLIGTADQSAITGTTVSAQEPAGFDWNLGPPPTPPLFVRPLTSGRRH